MGEMSEAKPPVEPSVAGAKVTPPELKPVGVHKSFREVAVGASGSGDPGDPNLPKEKTEPGSKLGDDVIFLPDRPDDPNDIRFLDDNGKKSEDDSVRFVGEPEDEIRFIDERPRWRKLLDRVIGR